MKKATVRIKGIAPYSQTKYHQTEKLNKERPDDYEKRTWRDKMHVNSDGFVFIPPMALKKCLEEAAKYLSIQILGKGKATYTKHFEAGVIVTEPIILKIKKEDVAGEWLFVPSDGKPGGSKRVAKCFPRIDKWGGDAVFTILDDIITQDIFERIIKQAGMLIGIGYFRPRNRGYWGRFEAKVTKWEELD